MLYRVRLRTAAQVDWRRTTRLAYGSLLDWVTPQTPHLTPHIPLYRYGSLLALSHDGFESITWATVASREPSLLVGDTPSVDISFPEVRHLATSKTLAQHRHAAPDPTRAPSPYLQVLHRDFQLAQARGVRFVLAESPTDFHSSRHVLHALKR